MDFKNGKIISAKGVIDTVSVNTEIDGLDSHLKNDDFFNVVLYPEILFESTNVDYMNSMLTADLTFHGVTKSVMFPVDIFENGLKADFLLNTTLFNMRYTGVKNEVRINFEFIV